MVLLPKVLLEIQVQVEETKATASLDGAEGALCRRCPPQAVEVGDAHVFSLARSGMFLEFGFHMRLESYVPILPWR